MMRISIFTACAVCLTPVVIGKKRKFVRFWKICPRQWFGAFLHHRAIEKDHEAGTLILLLRDMSKRLNIIRSSKRSNSSTHWTSFTAISR